MSRASEYVNYPNSTPRPEFTAWLENVDSIFEGRTGMSVFDMPDYDFSAEFESGTEARDMVQTILDEEGFPEGDDE